MAKNSTSALMLAPGQQEADAVSPSAPKPRQYPGLLSNHQINPERMRFYRLLWGDDQGYVYIVAGLPATDIAARGWPLAKDEPRDANSMVMLLWTRATGDEFKAAGRPHTGKVFQYPKEIHKIDRYIQRLADEYDNVFTRKYVAQSEQDAKYGTAPAQVSLVQVEDGPFGPPLPYTFTVRTSDYKQQAYYRLTWPIPWPEAQRLAEGASLCLPGSDTGGYNAAQFCRIPSTRNTKERALRFPVKLDDSGPQYDPDELARHFLPSGEANHHRKNRQKTRSVTPARNTQLDQPDGVPDLVAEDWRRQAWRDAKESEAAQWRPSIHNRRRGLLSTESYPRAFKNPHSRARIVWCGPGTGDQSADVYTIVKGLLLHGYTDGQALALTEYYVNQNCEHYARRGSELVWVDLCRILWKVIAELGSKRRIREVVPPMDSPPQARTSIPRSTQRLGRKPGQEAEQTEKLFALLEALPVDDDGKRHTTRAAHVKALGVGVRQITNYLKNLKAAGRIDYHAGPRDLIISIIGKDERAASAPDSDHFTSDIHFQGGNPIVAEGSVTSQAPTHAAIGEHTRPLATPDWPEEPVPTPSDEGEGVDPDWDPQTQPVLTTRGAEAQPGPRRAPHATVGSLARRRSTDALRYTVPAWPQRVRGPPQRSAQPRSAFVSRVDNGSR